MGNSVTPRAGTMLTPVPRNGVMEISGAVRLTVDCVDQKSGVVGQTATVNAVCGDVALGTPPTSPVVVPPVVIPPVLTPPAVVPPMGQLAQLRCAIAFVNTVFTNPAFTANISVTREVTVPDLPSNVPAHVEAVLRNASGDTETY